MRSLSLRAAAATRMRLWDQIRRALRGPRQTQNLDLRPAHDRASSASREAGIRDHADARLRLERCGMAPWKGTNFGSEHSNGTDVTLLAAPLVKRTAQVGPQCKLKTARS